MIWIEWALIIGTAILSWLLGFGTQFLAKKTGAIDQPSGGRKIHERATPLLGGVGIVLALMGALIVAYQQGWLIDKGIQPVQLVGFMGALALLLVVGCLDDYFDLPSWVRLSSYTFAALIIIFTGTTIVQVTRWVGLGGFSLAWHTWDLPAWSIYKSSLIFPADLLTLVWLLAVTFATKFLDGLDGLVTGQTVIAASLIAGLAFTHAYFQPAMALFALILVAAYLGFLPHNIHPAKQFLGESGSVVAGFALGFLAIVSGAKTATALMALGLPLADATFVILGRLARGASPFRGDDTHLHFKLLKAGMSQRFVVLSLWSIALLFGLAAFGVQTRGKVLLLIGLVGLTILLSIFAGAMKRSRIEKI